MDSQVVFLPDIIFQNKQNIDWREVEEYLKQFTGQKVKVYETGEMIHLGKTFANEYANSIYTRKIMGARAKAKANAVQKICEIVEKATEKRCVENTKKKHNADAKNGWIYYKVRFGLPMYNNGCKTEEYNIYEGRLVVNCASNGKLYAYDLVDIKKEACNPFKITEDQMVKTASFLD